jgi:hypothetical protein
MDTDGRFPTPTTRRTIVSTGVKLAYAAPLVAAIVKVSATNAAAAVSLGSLCEAGDVFFFRIAFGDEVGGVFYSPGCCSCGPAAACAASTPVDQGGTGNPDCASVVVGEGDEAETVRCFAICDRVP